jgi:hypothetical protein
MYDNATSTHLRLVGAVWGLRGRLITSESNKNVE